MTDDKAMWNSDIRGWKLEKNKLGVTVKSLKLRKEIASEVLVQMWSVFFSRTVLVRCGMA
jgi:hypothetical protein